MPEIAIVGGEGELPPLPPPDFLAEVKSKLDTYEMEAARCFCGHDQGKVIREQDRYGFNHRMICCDRCGLIYANPRMTEESYRKFYISEYRDVYDWRIDQAVTFKDETRQARGLKERLLSLGIKPRKVFDLGCGWGSWLTPFMDDAECMGVDLDIGAIQYGQSQGMPILFGDFQELRDQADLIILSHFLEHALDLSKTLQKVRQLLTDDGYVFVQVPNLFTWHLDRLFQNAHPYQFTPATLDYVMECAGFEKVASDFLISSIWKKGHFRHPYSYPQDEAQKIHDYLRIKVRAPTQQELAMLSTDGLILRRAPMVRGKNKFSVEERSANIAATYERGLPSMLLLEGVEAKRQAVIIGGGPSADECIEKIREYEQSPDYCVVAIERMLPWCLANSIMPEYVIALDASTDVVEALQTPPNYARYLVAFQCRPEVFDCLKRNEVYVFQTPQKELEQTGKEVSGLTLNSGGSVCLAAIAASLTLGMRNLHVFGFDCHIGNGSYAKNIAGVGEQIDHIKVRIEERDFITTLPYLSFAQQLFIMIQFARDDNLIDSIKVYGDSMATAMSREDIRGNG